MYIGYEGDKPPTYEYDNQYLNKEYYLVVPESKEISDDILEEICLNFKCSKYNIHVIKLNESYLKDNTKAYLIKK